MREQFLKEVELVVANLEIGATCPKRSRLRGLRSDAPSLHRRGSRAPNWVDAWEGARSVEKELKRRCRMAGIFSTGAPLSLSSHRRPRPPRGVGPVAERCSYWQGSMATISLQRDDVHAALGGFRWPDCHQASHSHRPTCGGSCPDLTAVCVTLLPMIRFLTLRSIRHSSEGGAGVCPR